MISLIVEQNDHYSLPERKYPSNFEAQTDGSTKNSNMSEEKDVLEDIVPKKSTQVGLIDDCKEIDTQQGSQQLAQILMPLLLQVLPVEEESNAPNTGWVAKLKMYTSYVS